MQFKSSILRESVLNGDSWEEEGIEFIEETGWQDEGKYSYNSYIFKYQDEYYEVSDSRSGSYYSDYYYESKEDWGEFVDCQEVEKKEVITYQWVTKKDE